MYDTTCVLIHNQNGLAPTQVLERLEGQKDRFQFWKIYVQTAFLLWTIYVQIAFWFGPESVCSAVP